MKNIYFRIKNAIKIGWWAFRNPETLRESNFKMCSSLLELILKVATEGHPMMTRLAYIHPDEGEKEIVSIWAGAGIGSEPLKRIEELLKENTSLKTQLSDYVVQNPQPHITP